MRRASRGFTLIEALLALAILAGAVAGLLTVRANAVRNTLRARNERIAAMLIGRLLVEVALAPPEGDTAEREVVGYPGFSYRLVLSSATVEPLGRVRKVRIEVRHPANGQEAEERALLAVETLLVREEK